MLRQRRKTTNHWIGMWAPGDIFFNEDNTDIDYTNWANGKPSYVGAVRISQKSTTHSLSLKNFLNFKL